MLATLAALHLLVLTQTSSEPPLPRKDTAAPAAPADAPPAPPPDAGAAPATPPPVPAAPQAGNTTYAAPRGENRQLSLLGAEPLDGRSAVLAEAGWSSLAVAYGQGVTREDDLGVRASFDWAFTDLRLGAFYRRPLAPVPPMDMAFRIGASYFDTGGATWIYKKNHHDQGFEVAPAVVFSRRAANGIFGGSFEVPVTVTFRAKGGVLLTPRIGLSYEAPFYGPYTLGVRGGFGYRFGVGDAPLHQGASELTFLVVAGYRVF